MLDELGGPGLFLDLRHPNATAVVRPDQAMEVRAPGVGTHVPAQNYDGGFFLEQSPMAEVL